LIRGKTRRRERRVKGLGREGEKRWMECFALPFDCYPYLLLDRCQVGGGNGIKADPLALAIACNNKIINEIDDLDKDCYLFLRSNNFLCPAFTPQPCMMHGDSTNERLITR
jgi:hypothetical protein